MASESLDKKTLRALSVETRQEIVRLLSKRPYTASELSKKLGKHVTTVSEHLRLLQDAGLIQKNPNGHKWIYFTLAEKGEKIFKPQLYSWVVVLALSFIMVFFGVYQMAGVDGYSQKATTAIENIPIISGSDASAFPSSAPVFESQIGNASAPQIVYQIPDLFAIALILIALGMFGIGFAIGKRMK